MEQIATNRDARINFKSRIHRAELSRRCLSVETNADRNQIKRAIRSGELVSPMRSLYARPEYWNSLTPVEQVLHCMRALQAMHPSWVFTGPTAAIVYGFDVPESYLWPIRVAVKRGSCGQPTKKLIRHIVEGDQHQVIDRLRVTSFERTVFDCVRELPFSDGLVVADAALRQSGFTRAELEYRIDKLRNTSKGGRHAMETMRYAAPRSASSHESRIRAAIIEMGFEAPYVHMVALGPNSTLVEAPLSWQLTDGTWVVGLFGPAIEGMRCVDLNAADLKETLIAAGVPLIPNGSNVGALRAFNPVLSSRIKSVA